VYHVAGNAAAWGGTLDYISSALLKFLATNQSSIWM